MAEEIQYTLLIRRQHNATVTWAGDSKKWLCCLYSSICPITDDLYVIIGDWKLLNKFHKETGTHCSEKRTTKITSLFTQHWQSKRWIVCQLIDRSQTLSSSLSLSLFPYPLSFSFPPSLFTPSLSLLPALAPALPLSLSLPLHLHTVHTVVILSLLWASDEEWLSSVLKLFDMHCGIAESAWRQVFRTFSCRPVSLWLSSCMNMARQATLHGLAEALPQHDLLPVQKTMYVLLE